MELITSIKRNWQKVALILILVLTGSLTGFKILSDGFGNLYYATAVKSMMLSPHNFFFVSFDPGGFVSVDKPPVALWIQTLFAFAFGFHGWSILMPEALAAVFSVLLVYHLIHRTFGFGAGIVSALALALSPIFIAVSRTNNLDSILVLDLLLSAWALLRATESGNIKMLLLAMLLAGIGFNIKMLEAYLVLPTFFLTYYFCKTAGLKRKIIHIAAAVAVLLVVSFSWAFAVDSTPADDRPYVGSSKTNSVVELAFGYNGVNRILSGLKWPESLALKSSGHPLKIESQQIRTAVGMSKAVPLQSAGAPGIFRLFNKSLGGQIGWFLLIALLGLSAFIIDSVKNGAKVVRSKMTGVIFWASWVLIMFVFFSAVNITHVYYLSVMTPGIAAMTGIGLSSLWSLYKNRGFGGYILPVALALNSAVQAFIISRYAGWSEWLAPLVVISCVCLSFALILLKIFFLERKGVFRLAFTLMAVCIALLFAAPAIWSASPIIYGLSQGNPIAIPESSMNAQTQNTALLRQNRTESESVKVFQSDVIRYLMRNRKGSEYIGAVQNAGTAENIILSTGMPVMTIGGYNGSDPILTIKAFERIVKKGNIRYFLINRSVDPRGQSAILKWITRNGHVISPSEIEGKSTHYINIAGYSLYYFNATQKGI